MKVKEKVSQLHTKTVQQYLPSFSREELIEMSKKEVYRFLATSHKLFMMDRILKEDENLSCMRLLRNQRLDMIKYIKELRAKYQGKLANEKQEVLKQLFQEVLDILDSEQEFQEKSNIAFQKKLYKEETNIFNSRTIVEVPLNRLWNALYDDMSIVAIFYDDISTLDTGDNLEKYETMSVEERMKFIEENIEFTHLALQATQRNGVNCVLMGKTVTLPNGESVALSGDLCDWNKTTLADTMKINNQDVRQFIQAKLNLDNEDLEIIDEQNIRGDIYQLKHDNVSGYDFIRFVCPSTDRVYYVEVDKRNLELSNYYDSKDIRTILPAWWSLTHLHANPYVDKKVYRC